VLDRSSGSAIATKATNERISASEPRALRPSLAIAMSANSAYRDDRERGGDPKRDDENVLA
jgi:hypothetical protein